MEKKRTYPVDPDFNHGKYRELFNKYRNRLRQLYYKMDMTGVMEASEDIIVMLKDIYVPLRVAREELDKNFTTQQVEAIKGQFVEETLCQINYLIISGAPGAGKSMLTKYLSMAVSDDYINPTSQLLGRRIVIPFILREFDFSKIESFENLWSAWISTMSERLGIKVNKEFFDFYIEKGWALIIFDGIDELGERTNFKLIDWINKWLDEVDNSNRLSKKRNRLNVIITGRPYGFIPEAQYEKHFEKMYLQPFNNQEIKKFVDCWFGIRYRHDKVELRIRVEHFLDALNKYEGLDVLKHRPIYVGILAFVFETHGELPYTRAVAYSKMVNAYLFELELQKRLNEKKGLTKIYNWTIEERWKIIEGLAYRIHIRASQKNESETIGNGKKNMHIFIDKSSFQADLAEILKTERFKTIKPENEEQLINFFLARSGLLVEPQQGYVQFSHLTFQEFLTASYIHRKQKKLNLLKYLKEEIFNRLVESGWQEVALLYFGIDTLETGEEQNEILESSIEPGNTNHHRFLIELLATTDHTLTDDQVKRWLKTLISYWIYIPSTNSIYVDYKKTVQTKLPELFTEICTYIETVADRILNNEPMFRSNELVSVETENAEDYKKFIAKPGDYNDVEKLFIIGYSWEKFRKSYLNSERLKKLSLITYFPTTLPCVLDRYLSFSSEISDQLADWIVSHLTISELTKKWGTSIFWAPFRTRDKIVRPALELIFTAFQCLIFDIKKIKGNEVSLRNAFGILREMAENLDSLAINIRFRDIDRAMSSHKTKDMVKARCLSRVRRMTAGIDWNKLNELGTSLIPSAWEFTMKMTEEMQVTARISKELEGIYDIATELRAFWVRLNKEGDFGRIEISHFFNIWWNSWIFSIYVYSTELASHMKYGTHIAKKEFEALFQQIETDEGVIKYFESRGCSPEDKQKKDIINWINEPASPRKLMRYILENTNYSQFDSRISWKDIKESINEFIDMYKI